VIALAWPDGSTRCFEGVCRGTIADTERGAGGFGYDAVFVPDAGDGRTFAEMSPEEKDAMSHRRAAVSELLVWLAAADRPD
jgi:XTP/dITP diphosphohydrolase